MKRKRGDKEEKERNYTKIEEEKKKKLDQKTYRYIGENSRSAYERAGEHLADLEDLNPGSYLLKHVIKHHIINPDQVEFRMKILTTHFTAFDRQITEAVKINRNAGPFLLNSKAEYNSIKTNDKKSEWELSELDDDQIAEGIKFLRK